MASSKGNRVFVWIILILLFVGLIGFGATGLSGNVTRLGTVGDKEIPVQSYANALQSRIRSFEQQTGQSMSLAQAQSLGLDRAVLGQVVTERVLDNEADELGLSVGDERVREQVMLIPAFRGLDGQFDRNGYRDTLQRNGLSVGEFEAGLREQEARALLQGAVVGGIAAPDAYSDALIDFVMERRDITWAPVSLAASVRPAGDGPRVLLPEIVLEAEMPEPTEAEIQARYEAAPEAYTSPEVRNLTYVWLTPDMLLDSVEVDEEQVRSLYDQRIDEYVQDERRLVERLVYPSLEAAESARAAVDAGEKDFEALVEARGLDLDATDQGDLGRDQLGAAADVVFEAAPGDVVGPVETNLGPALYRVNAILAGQEVPFEDVQDDLRDELAAAKARRVIDNASEEITDFLAGGATLEDLADRTDLELGTIEWTEGETGGIADYAPFRQAAAAVGEGDFPELQSFEDGGIFALRLDGVTEPALRPLDEVRDQVVADVKAETRRKAQLARAAELAKSVAEGASFAELGLDPRDVANLTRRDFVQGTGPDFVAEVFNMAEGDVQVLEGPDGALLVQLKAIADPDSEDPAVVAERDAIEQRLSAGIAQDIYQSYASEVQSETEIRIDDAAVQAVHNSFR